jgi:hypothetical protein
LIFTTDGSTDLATASTEDAAGEPDLRSMTGELLVPELVDVVEELESSSRAW